MTGSNETYQDINYSMNKTPKPEALKALLTEIYEEALAPALPENAMKDVTWPKVHGRIFLLAVGKAATQMAAAIHNRLPTGTRGLLITRQGYAEPNFNPEGFTIIEASHPVPDGEGARAAELALKEASALGEKDLLLSLISGGASALLPLPAKGLSLSEKGTITKALLHSGAPIGEMNIVRKHLSAIKGGRLAVAAFPAKTHMIGISDVPGDDISMIGSGPTVADASTCADALTIIDQYEIDIPNIIRENLENGELETPKPDNPEIAQTTAELCAKPADMCAAAVTAVQARGFEPLMLGDALEGDALELGREHARLALKLQAEGKKIAIISGGEATVTVRNKNGHGGRCSAWALAAAIALKGAPGIYGFAADSDGIDGSEDNAGAFLWPGMFDSETSLADAQRYLDNDNSYSAFKAVDALLMTGPSGTNVNDLRILLVSSD